MASLERELTAGPTRPRTGRWSEFTPPARHIKQACERYGVSKRTYLVILTLFDGTLTFADIFRRRYYPFPE